ncbi:MAG: MotA/TolQ/ExbB proton channel family protein [Calditrichaeota bacterium]|nr:MotA/TolQ/ExbB proton channel family protein [Calditrichota bacterium]MCB9369554.1 MotA/TolQ/ExbB proton channel family protein [Calditrichota bacterium]
MKTLQRMNKSAFGYVTLAALGMTLLYTVIAAAQPQAAREVTMSEKIGSQIVLYGAFDSLIYFFQGLLLFIGLGITIFYYIRYKRPGFQTELRKKVSHLADEVTLQSAINFEIESLQNKYIFLDLVIAAAPMSGLLGTVVGLVQVFSEQTFVEQVSMQSIAGGMYVAMVTTVCGLIVALFGVIGRHMLNSLLANVREDLAGGK